MIKVRYASIDGYRKTKVCKDIQAARAFAHYWVGATPELGSSYAISGDGVAKITVEGCSLRELFEKA